MALYETTLARLRKICLSLPETSEVTAWGHPNFEVGKKTFCVLEVYRGQLSVCLLPLPERHRELIEDSRWYPTPYIGQRGWLSRVVDGPLPWRELEPLIVASYRQFAPPRALEELDRRAAPPPRRSTRKA